MSLLVKSSSYDSSFPPLPQITNLQEKRLKGKCVVMSYRDVLTGLNVKKSPTSPHSKVTNGSIDINNLEEFPYLCVQSGGGSVQQSVVYKTSADYLDFNEASSILLNPDLNRVSEVPPFKPKGNEVYVVNGISGKTKDWACDGYRWVNKGRYGIPKKNPSVYVRCYNISNGPNDTKGSDLFRRRVYFINDCTVKLIQYLGDESAYVPFPHGNDKSENPTEYRRTFPSVLQEIKDKGTKKEPNAIYKEMVVNKSVPAQYQGVMNPRNNEQVRNLQRKIRRERRLSHDQIYNSLQLAYHLDGNIHDIAIYPDLSCLIAHPEILSELNKAIAVKSDEPVIISYDTTFEIGDFYVSVLVFRHVLFQGGITIPAAFLIHDRKSGEIHDRFWRKMVKLVPNFVKRETVIVTDREFGLRNAILENVPKAKLFYCWNHIRSDIKHFLREHGGGAADRAVYTRDVISLLQSENLEEFNRNLNDLSDNWSMPFKEYFHNKLEKDIVNHAARWILEDANVYDPYSGTTNNIVESMNAVIKRLIEWKEVPIDSAVLSF